MGPAPETPFRRFCQLVARSLPMGVIAAMPVTTTRLSFMVYGTLREK